MKIKYVILTSIYLFCLSTPFKLFTQKDFRAKFSAGYFNNPWNNLVGSKYQNPRPGEYLSFAGEYDITKKWGLRFAGLNANHRYYDAGNLTNDPDALVYTDGTNSSSYNLIVGAEVIYQLLKKKYFDIRLGWGVGILSNVRKFTTRTEYDLNGRHIVHWNYRDQAAFNDMLFPISIQLEYKITEILGFYLDSGTYIEPDFPVMGLHGGIGIFVAFR